MATLELSPPSLAVCFQAAVTECLTQAAAVTSLPGPPPPPPAERPAPALAPEGEVSMDLEQLRRELATALHGHGIKPGKADAILKSLGSLKDAEKVSGVWWLFVMCCSASVFVFCCRPDFVFFLSPCVPPWEEVAYVTRFNSPATWAATVRLDMTSAVDWALKAKLASIYLSVLSSFVVVFLS